MSGRQPWTAADDAALRDMAAAGLPDGTIAETLGRTPRSVSWRRGVLGLVPPRPPAWTTREEWRLLGLLESHATYARIAAELGRTVAAVKARCFRLGGRRRGTTRTTAGGQPLAVIARMFGVDDTTVAWWVGRGWLRASRTAAQVGGRSFTMVDRTDLLGFVRDERRWHLFDPARITDPVLRDEAREVRGGLVFWSTVEVGRRLGLTHGQVNHLIRQGRIRAVKRGPAWLVRSDHVVYPDRLRNRRRRRSVAEADWPAIRAAWGVEPAAWIARRLGYGSANGVVAAARAMGLPPLGRGYWRQAAHRGVLFGRGAA